VGSELDDVQAALGAAYSLERELGRGGMATVYLARDTKHERRVALKVLHPDHAVQLGPQRFRREIATAAALQHPHILGVHDSGETASGLLWFTMPYVEGETLRTRLDRQRQLPVEDALRITREIAGALAYAHARGVLHRDVKPENILLTEEGDALLADFGIARGLGVGAGTSLTQTGIVIGTAQYMSPEQASGERTIDRTSDIYSLGAVCYEMLAGEPPFSGPTAQAIIAKMLSSPAPSVRVLRPAVPESVDVAVRKALAPVPADRWPTASDFARALTDAERAPQTAPVAAPAESSRRRVPVAALALALGVLIGGGVLFAWRSHAGGRAAGDDTGPIRVAVLPFENVGDSSDAYFADGMTEAVREKMIGLPGLEVIGSASSGQYRHTTKTTRQIGNELGARYLLEGRVRWAKGAAGAPSRVRVSTELIDAGSAADKWGAPFDAPLTDVFQVQGQIAGQVAQALQVALTPSARQTLTAAPTANLAAYDAYLHGKSLDESGSNAPVALRGAIAAYREAIAADSNFALAWSALASTMATLDYDSPVPFPGLADSVDAASARALALAPDLPDAHLARAAFYGVVHGDHARAITELRAGLAHGADARMLTMIARAEESLGRWDSAGAHAAQAMVLDPRDPLVFHRAAEVALWRRQTTEAERVTQRALALAPGRLDIIEYRMMASLQRGDLPAAQAVLADVPPTVDALTLAGFLANYWDLGWALDSAHEARVLALRPESYADVGTWAFVLAQQYRFKGDDARMRIYADSAIVAYAADLKGKSVDVEARMFYALSLAYAGRGEEAVREIKDAVAAHKSKANEDDARDAPYVEFQLARVYTAAGEPDKAIDVLQQILARPFYVTPAWLKIDPNFAPLRGLPRFEALVNAAPPIS
jgi:eukaryotic-like serine/threonine-protein kinase